MTQDGSTLPQDASPVPDPEDPTRREFLARAGATISLLAAGGCGMDMDAFLQKNFREMTPAELKAVLERLEKNYSARFGKEFKVSATPALPQTVFGYGLDLSRCIGCRRCAYACAKENNQSRDPQVHWIRVLQMSKDRGVDLSHADAYYDPEKVPDQDSFYLPVACQQCEDAPCVKVCPVQATWQEPDGIVVIDYDWCIGCRCCMAACPYYARRFNWGDPTLPPEEANPVTDYLGNRPRPRGVVEKCTFCIQRVRNGRYPACLEVCPVGARKFGNLLDPQSEIRQIMQNKRVFRLKEDLGTSPKFFYFYGT